MESYQEKMIREIEIRGLASSTQQGYLRSVAKFLDFISKDPNEIELEDIKKYLHHVRNRDVAGRKTKMAANSVNKEASSIAFFCKHVLGKNYYGDIPRIKPPKREHVILTQDEINKMINGLQNIFWKSLLMMLYSTGMRQSEIRNLKTSDIDRDRMIIIIRNAKGAKDRLAILSPNVLECLTEYWKFYRLRLHKDLKSDYLFVPNKNTYDGELKKKLSHTAVGHIVKRAAEIAGVKKKFILTV